VKTVLAKADPRRGYYLIATGADAFFFGVLWRQHRSPDDKAGKTKSEYERSFSIISRQGYQVNIKTNGAAF
jgi:hypothetical protein